MKSPTRLLQILSITMAVILLLGSMPLSVLATAAKDLFTSPMTLSVVSKTGMPGETVKVMVNVSDNPGIASLKFDVEYDSVLTLIAVDFNSEFGSMVTAPEPYTNPQPITCISPLTDITAEGTFVTLKFKIAENAKDQHVANISITYDENDILDGEYNNIALDVENGAVTVIHGLPGDINKDQKVNTKDAILLFRHIAGWSGDVDLGALDVNGDSNINTKDAITLFRYVAGWDVEIFRGSKKECNHSLVADAAIAYAQRKGKNYHI